MNWEKTQAAFEAGNYSESLRLLQEIEPKEAAFHYHEGLIYLKTDQPAQALASFETAQNWDSWNSTLRAQIQAAKSAIQKKHGVLELDPASHFYESWVSKMPFQEMLALWSAFLLVFTIFVLKRRRRLPRAKLFVSAPWGIAWLLCTLVFLGAYSIQKLAQRAPKAIVLETTTVRGGPGDSFLELAQLTPGVAVRVAQPSETWTKVRYQPQAQGWIPNKNLRAIRIE